MPIYEYRCGACGHELEALQKLSDPVLTQCPACEQDSLKKKVSAAAFRLKGGGWYETDFKSDGKRNLAGDEAKPKEKAAEKPKDGGGESKTDKKKAETPKPASGDSTATKAPA